MTLGRRYAAGFVVVVLAAGALSALLGGADRTGVLVVLGLVAAVQVPLGWWLVRSVGRPSVVGVWVFGMLARFGLVAIAGLVIVPRLGLPAQSTLVSVVGLLFALLLVEGTVLWLEHLGSGAAS
ncbi:MAG TPA: hypothetical protein VMG41_02590 [Gemmatimonadales bacterium]|nr:hypothetical protein [Gemmatimonadales bacterium]